MLLYNDDDDNDLTLCSVGRLAENKREKAYRWKKTKQVQTHTYTAVQLPEAMIPTRCGILPVYHAANNIRGAHE